MMQRTYRGRLQRASAGFSAAAATLLSLPAGADASGLFNAQPLDQGRFAVLAKPVGQGDWTLLVLEQITTAPRCWEQRADGLIDPALNRFDFTGICSRYLDSNGYSLRIGDQDLASRYRLRLEQRGSGLSLLAMTPSNPTQLLVGRGAVPQRDRDGFVLIQLEPGWQLQRRAYGQQTLSHVYFANATPLPQLLSAAGAGTGAPGLSSGLSTVPAPRPPRPTAGTGPARGPIALQVVPFNPQGQ
jgi:hypothetical protein